MKVYRMKVIKKDDHYYHQHYPKMSTTIFTKKMAEQETKQQKITRTTNRTRATTVHRGFVRRRKKIRKHRARLENIIDENKKEKNKSQNSLFQL